MKPITLTDEQGKIYKLEFDVNSVEMAEADGFVLSDVEKKPMTSINLLFHYAFIKHQPEMTKEQTMTILDDLGGVMGLPKNFIDRLGELYSAPFKAVGRKNSIKVEL